MSVLIKGMAMPRGCDECYIREKDACPLLKVNVGEWGRMLNCPLIELPDHGDLVDIDAMLNDFAELRYYDIASREYVVIPAEMSASPCDNCDERSDAGCSWCKKMERSEDGET